MKQVAVLVLVAALPGCVTLADRPTEEMVELQLRKEKKLVEFVSALPPAELTRLAVASGCGKDQKTLTTVSPVGGSMVGVSSTYDYTLEVGDWADGSSWVAVRTDGVFHGTPMGYKLVPEASGGSRVTVYAADSRKIEAIRQGVESGRLLCDWRSVSYPYD
ncbi:hypothetical protein WCE34_14065 [Luteimonas sp. MJ204]|uniref:hypothetical protein n=1 Tax=Luteimonas TaxID=83614 RepID=UPI0031BB81B7